MNKVFLTLTLTAFSSMIGMGIIIPLLPIYAENLGATGIWIGIIFAGFSITRVLLMPVFGTLSDRIGRKLLLCVGLFSFSLLSLGYIWAGSVYELTAIRLLQGASVAMVNPVARAYVGDLAPRGAEGKFIGYYNASFLAGFGVGPLLGGVLVEFIGTTSAFAAMSALNFVAFILCLLYLPRVMSKTRPEGADKISSWGLARSPVFLGLFNYRLMYGIVWGSFAAFLPILGSFTIGLNTSQIGIIMAANLLLSSAMHPFTGRLADVIDRRWMVIAGGSIIVIFMMITPGVASFYSLLSLALLGGIGRAFFMPATSAMTMGEGRKWGMGAAMGVANAAMGLGQVIGAIMGGVLLDWISIEVVFYMGAGIQVLGILIFTVLTHNIIVRRD